MNTVEPQDMFEDDNEKVGLNSSQIKEKLRIKYGEDKGYCYLEELDIRGIGGITYTRRIDAVVISTWPSLGLNRTAFEIKISKADLMNEFKDPDKSNAAFEYFEYFCLAIPNLKVIKNVQIPDHWGIYVVTDKGVRTYKAPKFNESAKCDSTFVGRICQKMMAVRIDREDHHRIMKEMNDKVDELVKQKHERSVYNAEYYERELKSLKEKVKSFEEASGIKIEWSSVGYLKELGGTIKFLTSGKGLIDDWEIKSIREVGEKTIAIADELKKVSRDTILGEDRDKYR